MRVVANRFLLNRQRVKLVYFVRSNPSVCETNFAAVSQTGAEGADRTTGRWADGATGREVGLQT